MMKYKEEFLLIKLIEECAEVQHRTTKILRFGLNEIQEGQSLDNKQRLHDEIVDLQVVLRLIQKELCINMIPTAAENARVTERIEKYYEISKQLNNQRKNEMI